jgi:hypothetical protein
MKANATLVFLALLTTTAAACSDRLLVGSTPDGGGPTTGAAGTGISTGAAGSGISTGAGGSGISTGAGGSGISTGAAGTPDAGIMTGSGGSGATRVVTPLEISGDEAITRLAQVLWREPPSVDLMSQANQGRFKTTDDLYGVVRQLLADPRARKGLGAFYRWWLKLDELKDVQIDAATFPTYTPQLAADMADETETFAVEVTLMAGGRLDQLLAAPYSYINERLAGVYGVAGVMGEELRQVNLDSTRRAGIVTQPALQVLNAYPKRNSPSRRGTYMLSRFQCFDIPTPPPDTLPLPDTLPANVTVRQGMAMVINQANCAACHLVLDPPGLLFETFDALGRWRTTDNGQPIDMTNIDVYHLASEGPVRVDGPVTYAQMLDSSERTHACMARQWLSYLTGKRLDQVDEASVQYATKVFQESGRDLKELIFAVLTSQPFLQK